ncbi:MULTISPECIES: cytochrome b/b6 domain-containing protein [Shewanella]|uniref:cytochrome b/b6 domain-containing protein n=1 Tax=Shewanella TaxID=22 RepID=UPI001C65A449|nr:MULTISPECIES: cytochrome b/b6 domain-containing protein [Shewanella]QYJ76261.1 cytochrome b/b6 domain-containing protein [Shewanella sp. FJAT-52076]QYK06179.1 cytochrome b/b6 domain-containing protein [Shewanella zhangzhouensis]
MTHAKVWDLPVRLFHWLMVTLLGLLWWSAEVGEMQWHQVFAYSLMALLLFRVLWGFVGSDTARFAHFLHHPLTVVEYAKTTVSKGVKGHHGHNPLGGYMVLVLLLCLALQLISGLFATDEVFTEGPLVSMVSSDTASWMTWLHKRNFDLLLILAAVHVLAVVWHLLKGDRLLGAMVTGRRRRDDIDVKSDIRFAPLWKAAILLVLVALPVGYLLLWPAIQAL